MTNEQAKRLDAAIAKAGLNWWEVQRQVGFDVFNDVVAIEKTIAIIEEMAQTEEAEEKEMTTEVKVLTMEDAEKAVMAYANENIYTNEQWEADESFSAMAGQEVTEEIYEAMLNVLPPLRLPKGCGYDAGFRVGEPYAHEQSRTTGEYLAHYAAFGKKDGRYYFLGNLNKHGERCSTDRNQVKAVIYIRGANEEQQYTACMEYAKEYEISVFEVTKDFGRIAELVVNGEIDAVIVHDFTRLTRDAMECHNKVHQFRGYGVTILATK